MTMDGRAGGRLVDGRWVTMGDDGGLWVTMDVAATCEVDMNGNDMINHLPVGPF